MHQIRPKCHHLLVALALDKIVLRCLLAADKIVLHCLMAAGKIMLHCLMAADKIVQRWHFPYRHRKKHS